MFLALSARKYHDLSLQKQETKCSNYHEGLKRQDRFGVFSNGNGISVILTNKCGYGMELKSVFPRKCVGCDCLCKSGNCSFQMNYRSFYSRCEVIFPTAYLTYCSL